MLNKSTNNPYTLLKSNTINNFETLGIAQA